MQFDLWSMIIGIVGTIIAEAVFIWYEIGREIKEYDKQKDL